MGKARVYGSNAKIYVKTDDGTDVKVGEVDKFSAKSLAELKKSQPLGEKLPASNLVHAGWELSFEGGKVDANTAALFHSQDKQIVEGLRAPYFQVVQEVKYYDGNVDVYSFEDVTLHGYSLDAAGAMEELGEKFEGFAAKRTLNTDATNTSLDDTDALIEASLTNQGSQDGTTYAVAP